MGRLPDASDAAGFLLPPLRSLGNLCQVQRCMCQLGGVPSDWRTMWGGNPMECILWHIRTIIVSYVYIYIYIIIYTYRYTAASLHSYTMGYYGMIYDLHILQS